MSGRKCNFQLGRRIRTNQTPEANDFSNEHVYIKTAHTHKPVSKTTVSLSVQSTIYWAAQPSHRFIHHFLTYYGTNASSDIYLGANRVNIRAVTILDFHYTNIKRMNENNIIMISIKRKNIKLRTKREP